MAALAHARRTARQLAHVTEMYWQLKFDHGELKAKAGPGRARPPAPSKPSCPCRPSRSVTVRSRLDSA